MGMGGEEVWGGEPGPEGGMCRNSGCFPQARRLQPDGTDFSPQSFSPSFPLPPSLSFLLFSLPLSTLPSLA